MTKIIFLCHCFGFSISGVRAPSGLLYVTTVWALRGFCIGLQMVCVTVALWHRNTQQSLQAACSVHSESQFYWKGPNQY